MLALGLGTGMPQRRLKRLFVPSNAVFLCDGDSISAQTDGRSMASHLVVRSGGRISFAANAYTPPSDSNRPGTIGVSGKKIADQTLNVADAFTANPAVTHVIFHCGTNDLSPTPPSQMQADFLAYCDAWNSRGIKIIFSGILKRADTVGLDANNEARRAAFNAWAATQVGTHGLVWVVNHDGVFDPVADPTLVKGPPDLLHPTWKGMGIVAQNIVSALNFQASMASLMPANVVTNPTLSGTSGVNSGGVTGVVPTSWTIQNTTGATVTSEQGTENGVTFLDIIVSGTASATSQVRLSRNDSAVGLTAGQWVEGKMRLRIGNAANTGDAIGVAGWHVQAANGYTFNAGHDYSGFGHMGTQFNGDVRILPLKASGAVNGTTGFYMRLVTGVACDIRVRLYGDIVAGRLS